MKSQIIEIEHPDGPYDVHCPVCGKEVAKSETPCAHVDFIWLAMEPGDFNYISHRFTSRANAILEAIGNLLEIRDNDEEIDEEMLSIESHLELLENTETSFMVKVSSGEFRNYQFSDLGIFGFNLEEKN